MGRDKAYKTYFNPSIFKVALLLIQFVLVKLGQVPFSAIKVTVDSLQWTVGKISSVTYTLPRFRPHRGRPPKVSTNQGFVPWPKLPSFHRGRGRPSKYPLPIFYLQKMQRFIKRRLPLRTKIAFILAISLLILFLYTSFILTAAYQLPSPKRLVSQDQPLTTEFYDRNGKLLYRMYEGRNRSIVTLDELPKYLIQATIASEDKNFYHNWGVDPVAITRAAYHNLRNGGQEGASTITQQLIKNSLLTPEKTYARKIKEIILSLWAGTIYSKNDILQMYFNEVAYGGPAWGIEAASQTYFGKGAKDLDLAESALLAGLPASPTEFSPYGNSPNAAKNRQVWVLQRMMEEGYITADQKAHAQVEELNLKPASNNILAPHFVFYVRDLLAQKYGLRVVSQGGLKITTSLDLDIQKEVEKIVKNEVESLAYLNVNNGASLVTDAKTGQILAMVGSRDYHYDGFGNFNVTTALRQPGSSIKPATYTTAFKLGFSPGNTILDAPVAFKDGVNTYSPQNYDGKYHGPVSIRTALGSSYNIPAVKMLATVGIDKMVATAQDLGITTFNDPNRFGLSLTLGGGEVKMIDMMSMYGTFSQMGKQIRPTAILKVTDSAGNVLEEYTDGAKQAIDPEIAYLITSILTDNSARTPSFGSNSLLNIPGQFVAVKTGTSDNKKDNWTFGYSKDFVIGVWVGNNDNSLMNPSLTSGVTGAAPIWRRITDFMLTKYPSSAFAKPSKIAEGLVDGRKDLIVAGAIPKSLVRFKKEEDKLIFSDAFSSFATSSAQAAIKNEATN